MLEPLGHAVVCAMVAPSSDPKAARLPPESCGGTSVCVDTTQEKAGEVPLVTAEVTSSSDLVWGRWFSIRNQAVTHRQRSR